LCSLLLRNCAFEPFTGGAIDEDQAEIGRALPQAANNAPAGARGRTPAAPGS
jgi:hypothetical protein